MSLNDPNWGRQGGPRGPGGNQGPPDLDELWRNFNRKLNGLFGARRGGGGDRPPSAPSGRMLGGGAGVLLALIVVVWLASGFYMVVEGQRAVVFTFGRFAELAESGLHWRMPYPLQSHEVVNLQQVRIAEVGYRGSVKSKLAKESLMLTDDENIVDVQIAVQYTVKDAKDYLFNNRRPEDSVLQAAETAIREVVGKSKMDAVLNQGQKIAEDAAPLMQAILDRYGTGIHVNKVDMQNAQPPEDVQMAFDDAQKAGQDRERLKNDGESYFNDVVPKARGTAARLKQEADGYRASVVANAEGEAARFRQVLVEYAKAPAVTSERMYIDTLQEVLSSTSKVILDAKGGGNLLYLPLDKLLQQSGAGLPEAAGAARAAPEPLSPDADFRSRDSTLRNRDRGERR